MHFVGQPLVVKDSKFRKKSTPFAAQIAAERAGTMAKDMGMVNVR